MKLLYIYGSTQIQFSRFYKGVAGSPEMSTERRKQGSREILNCVEHCIKCFVFYVNYVEMSEMLSSLLTAPGWTPDITSRSTLHTCKAREEVMTG